MPRKRPASEAPMLAPIRTTVGPLAAGAAVAGGAAAEAAVVGADCVVVGAGGGAAAGAAQPSTIRSAAPRALCSVRMPASVLHSRQRSPPPSRHLSLPAMLRENRRFDHLRRRDTCRADF